MNNELLTIGPEIAKHLPGWRFICDDEYRTTRLIPAEATEYKRGERSICLQVDHKRRIHIHGCWPFSGKGSIVTPGDLYVDGKRQESPRISVAIKDPKKIAADIQRRFLSAYLDLYAKCVAKIETDDAGYAKQHEVAKEFAAIMGDTTENAHASWFGKDCYGKVDVNWAGDTATLELRGDVRILKAALEAAGKAGAFKK